MRVNVEVLSSTAERESELSAIEVQVPNKRQKTRAKARIICRCHRQRQKIEKSTQIDEPHRAQLSVLSKFALQCPMLPRHTSE
jgi:hypothetical protein